MNDNLIKIGSNKISNTVLYEFNNDTIEDEEF